MLSRFPSHLSHEFHLISCHCPKFHSTNTFSVISYKILNVENPCQENWIKTQKLSENKGIVLPFDVPKETGVVRALLA
jgi:hypothetical protein